MNKYFVLFYGNNMRFYADLLKTNIAANKDHCVFYEAVEEEDFNFLSIEEVNEDGFLEHFKNTETYGDI